MRFVVQMAAFNRKPVLDPESLNMYQRALSLAEQQVLQRGYREEVVLAELDRVRWRRQSPSRISRSAVRSRRGSLVWITSHTIAGSTVS